MAGGFLVTGGQIAAVERAPYPHVTSGRRLNMGEHRYMSYEQVWRSQPQLRLVTGFIARQMADVGITVYQEQSGAPVKTTIHPIARMLRNPVPATNSKWTHYRLVDAIMHYALVYDNAYLLKIKADKSSPVSGVMPVPSRMVAPMGDDWTAPEQYRIRGNLKQVEVPPEAIVHIHGWNPMDVRTGVSPIETLRLTLAEEYSAMEYRNQMWRSGARTSGYISRPAAPASPEWSTTARDRFLESWASAWSGESQIAGGTPILEDGMKWEQASMTPKEAQYVESRQLTLQEVMAAYWLPMENITTTTDSTALASLEDRRTQLYGDSLAPWASQIEQDIELQLLPDLDMGGWADGTVTVAFDFYSKMRGNFSQQTQDDVAASGAPWMSRNEVRARRGLPPKDGGDELITPMNVTQGGLANPRDTAPTNPDNAASNGQPDLQQTTTHSPAGSPKNKARSTYRPEPDRSVIGDAMKAYYAKVAAAVMPKIGAEAKARRDVSVPAKGIPVRSVFDRKRFDAHLAKDLAAASKAVAVKSGKDMLSSAGQDPSGYSSDLVDHYMAAMADGMAVSINDSVQSDLADALDSDDPVGSAKDLFDSYGDKADTFATSQTTAMSSFGAEDAAEKNDMPMMKTWSTGDNPRPEHAAMDGESVARGETFSDGSRWPGDSQQPPELRDGCNCTMDFTVGE